MPCISMRSLCLGVVILSSGLSNHAIADNPSQPVVADDFIDYIGVNTHLNRASGFYTNIPGVESELRYLGVRYARDTFSGHTHIPFMRQIYQDTGVKFDIIFHSDFPYDTQLADLRANNDMVVEIEGPNEVDNWPTSFLGLLGFGASTKMQKTLYDDIKTYPSTKNKSVHSLTLANESSLPSIGNLSSYADTANVHSYLQWGGYWGAFTYPSLQWSLNTFGVIAPQKPKALTETGWWTQPASWGVPEEVQAKFLLTMLFDAYLLGSKRTYIYQLNDEYDDPNGTDIEKHFGLFKADGTPKKAAFMMQNLSVLLGGNYKGFVPTPLNYSLAGLPSSTGHQLLLEKSNSHFVLVLWNEGMFWDNIAHTAIPTTSVPVTVKLDKEVAGINVFDPLASDAFKPLLQQNKLSSIEVQVPDHPIFVVVIP